jgi:hypothetical protein
VIALLLPLWLTIAPPDPDYPQAAAQLDAALEAVGSEDIDGAIEALEQALEQAMGFPEGLSTDTGIQEKLAKARISLVALLLERGDAAAAAVAMDEAIRSARGNELPVRSFGPDVLRLYEQRRTVLEGLGTGLIEVDCEIPCDVVVDERLSPNPSDPLIVGTYRVWVGASDDSAEWAYFEVAVDTPGETESVVYRIAKPEAVTRPEPILDSPPPKAKRLLPRWTEVLGLTAGVGLAVVGGVLLSFNGKCRGGGSPSSMEECPDVYDNTAQGYALVGVGAGVFALAGVMLVVDEVRVGRTKAQQAMLTWTFRF